MHQFDRQFFEETSVHAFTAEISELQHGKQLEGRKGLPKSFMLPGVGNGQPFFVTHVERREGDLMYVKYLQGNGCVTATIFND